MPMLHRHSTDLPQLSIVASDKADRLAKHRFGQDDRHKGPDLDALVPQESLNPEVVATHRHSTACSQVDQSHARRCHQSAGHHRTPACVTIDLDEQSRHQEKKASVGSSRHHEDTRSNQLIST